MAGRIISLNLRHGGGLKIAPLTDWLLSKSPSAVIATEWRNDVPGQPGDAFTRETFRLPVEAARVKAREILDQLPQDGYMTIVEQWRQLSDGQIEFTMRRLRATD